MEKNKNHKKINIEKTLKILSRRKEVPKSAYILIVLLYTISIYFVLKSARSPGDVIVLGRAVPKSSFTGVYSSLGNLCVIFLVVLFKQTGYVTAMFLLLFQFPMLVINVFVNDRNTGIPGIFTNIVTILAITLIFFYNQRMDKYQKSIRDQAVIDALTKLPNRFACNELIHDLAKHGTRFSVVSINLNSFKNINDTMGRDTGDKILIEIANRLKTTADSGTTESNDFVARLNGDEYMIILRDYISDEALKNAIHVYKGELEKKMTIDDCDYFITSFFGYAEFPSDTRDVDLILSYADAAMHEAKRAGNTGRILHFDKDYLDVEHSLEIERKIRAALDNDTIFYYLQPQYDIDKKLRGFEALARMRDSDGSMISPVDFIPVAERTGLIDRLDIRIFEHAVSFLEKMIKEKRADIVISINISVRHLMKNNFLDDIRKILDSHDVPADHIEVEITESIMIDSVEKALKCINDIKNMGMKIAIDDFGTGYSSLSYLNNFPADMLKIDKSFIDVMNDSDLSKQYVATIISIGHILNLKVISEGVETQDQLDTLRSNGCDFIQGYIWGKPMLPEKAEALL